LRFGDGDVRGGALLCRKCGIEGRLRGRTLDDELLGAAEVELGLVQIGLGPLDAGLLQVDIGVCDGEPCLLFAHPGLKLEGSIRASTWPCFTSVL
jgi:hypothetical protein